jgi:electron transport complex protein RnfG
MERRVWTGDELAPAAEDPVPGDESIYAGFDETGRFVGWAIPAEGAGFQDTIRLLYGYVPEREEIVGMRVLESRETPGLGDRILKDPAFVAEFEGLAVEPRIE